MSVYSCCSVCDTEVNMKNELMSGSDYVHLSTIFCFQENGLSSCSGLSYCSPRCWTLKTPGK